MGAVASVPLGLWVAVGVPLSLGQLAGLIAAPEVLNWYPNLRKPKWTIPTPLFGPAWGALYTAMGYASWRAWRAGAGPLPLGLYAAQLAFNLAWQPLFFNFKNFKLAKLDLAALLGVLAATTWQFAQLDPQAGKLMLPYLGFCVYATALTWSIAGKNPGQGSVGGGERRKLA